MQLVKRNRRWRHLPFVASVIVLFGLFYLYVLLRVRPELFYQLRPNVFLFDWAFFTDFMTHAGGPVEYASVFLSPLFVCPWLGALVITFLTVLNCLATRHFFAAATGDGGHVLFLIPAVLILVVLGQYIHPVNACAGLFIALVLANMYVLMGGCHVVVRFAAFAVLSALSYYAVAGMYLVLASLCGVFEAGVKRNRLLGALYAMCAVVVPSAGGWLIELDATADWRKLLLPHEEVWHWLAYPLSMTFEIAVCAGLLLFFPVAAMVLVWRRRRRALSVCATEDPDAKEPGMDAGNVPGRPVSGRRLAACSVTLVLLAVLADAVSFDFPKRCLLGMEVSAEREEWDRVLAQAKRLPFTDARTWDPRTAFQINRALYFNGCLLDEMFAYPQIMGAPSLALAHNSAQDMAAITPEQCSEILFDLGRVNESEHMAYEALETCGKRPCILKRLVLVNVIKGQPQAAQRFLGFLKCSMLYSRWARRYQQLLDVQPMLAGDPTVTSRRELMVVRDSVSEVSQLEAMLEGLLERNRQNRMAFEYLMAHYLLTRQVDRLAANLPRFDEFNYKRLPRHYEEALMICLAAGGSQNIDTLPRRISPETRDRFVEFVRAEQQWGDASTSFSAIYRDFGDTYFFCYVFGHNDPSPEPSR